MLHTNIYCDDLNRQISMTMQFVLSAIVGPINSLMREAQRFAI